MLSGRQLEGLMGANTLGVVYGFYGDAPGSGLTWTYTEALVRVRDVDSGKGFAEFRIAGGTVVVAVNQDTYVYVDVNGAVQSTGVANGAAKPTLATIGEHSQFIAKLVSDGSDITTVEDLRGVAGAALVTIPVECSFEAAEVGAYHFVPGFKGRIIGLHGKVTNALAATDAGTVTPNIKKMGGSATAVTDADLSFAASAAVGAEDLEIASDNHYFGPFDEIQLVSAKSTAGGLALVTVVCEAL